MKKTLSLVSLFLLILNSLLAQETKDILKLIHENIKVIDKENIVNVLIFESVIVTDENGTKQTYLEEEQNLNIYQGLFETENYYYFTDIKIHENSSVRFYTDIRAIKRVEKKWFGGLQEVVYLDNKNDILRTEKRIEDADVSIEDSYVTLSEDVENGKIYKYKIDKGAEQIGIKDQSHLFKTRLKLKNDFPTFLNEATQDIYIIESCKAENEEGSRTFSFKDIMTQDILQIILSTSDYYYILKVKKDSLSDYQVCIDYENIKRIKRSYFKNNTCEYIYLDEFGRFIKSELLIEDVDYKIEDDKTFILTENKDIYHFNFLLN